MNIAEERGASLPTGTITLLLTDIEGSTKRWEVHPQVMHAAVRRHDEILVHAIECCGGVDLRKKGEGDSHFAVFSSAANALAAALEIHRALAGQDWGELGSINVRVAIHTGDAELRNEDYFGPAVNRCARLRAIAYGGQTVVSEATKRLVKQLPANASFRDLGVHRLKDLLEPERVYQLNADGLQSEFPPLRSLSAAKHNLPVQLSTFIGRTEQLEKIKGLLYRNRLVTLTGAGGSGKTRLALQVGAEVVEEFPDGVWFVPLVGIQDGALIPQAIGEALPISIHGRDPLEAIVDEYSESRPLVIVDNCEHLVKAVASTLNVLLRKCPQMVVLATSREQLSVSGEAVYSVPPMQCDLHGQEADVGNVAKLEAVQLFRDRAAKRLSDCDILTADTALEVAALCKKLDGLPLALEQAAANLSYMSPKEILDRLDAHFQMLELDEEGVEDRHKTIQATIDWSYERLSDQEKDLFASLSIFVGGWSRDAAEFVCGGLESSPPRVNYVLDSLTRRSLVTREQPTGDHASRFRMLEPIRQYASSRLSALAHEALTRRLFDWCYGVAKQASDAGIDYNAGYFKRLLSVEHDNIRAALGSSLSTQGFGLKPLELCIWMYRYWLAAGHIKEGSAWLQRALDKVDDADPRLRAQALLFLGILVWQQGNLDGADKALVASRDAFESIGDGIGVAKVNANLGSLAFSRENFEEAEAYQSAAARMLSNSSELGLYATTLENWAVTLSKLGRLDEAETTLRRVVQIRQSLKVAGPLAKTMDSLLGIYSLRGVLLEHVGEVVEAIELTIESNDPFVMESVLELCVALCLELKLPDLAAEAIGAIEGHSQTSERTIPRSLAEFRESLAVRATADLGRSKYRSLVRSGRSLGMARVLKAIRRKVDDMENFYVDPNGSLVNGDE